MYSDAVSLFSRLERPLRNLNPVIFIMSVMFILLSIFMTLPVLLLVTSESPNALAFAESAAICFGTGLLGILATYRQARDLKPRYMFVLTVSSWFIIALLSSLPFYLSDLGLTLGEAFFEGTSGITTTGATVLTGLDTMDQDLLLWRSVLQWIGGIGIIGMFVAVLPFLRVGGMRLFATESSEWTDKALPRMKTLSRGLLLVYVVFSVLAVTTYWLSGMSLFDAFNHGLTSIATGGFSTSDYVHGQVRFQPDFVGSHPVHDDRQHALLSFCPGNAWPARGAVQRSAGAAVRDHPAGGTCLTDSLPLVRLPGGVRPRSTAMCRRSSMSRPWSRQPAMPRKITLRGGHLRSYSFSF